MKHSGPKLLTLLIFTAVLNSAHAEVWPLLRMHDLDFPAPDFLKSMMKIRSHTPGGYIPRLALHSNVRRCGPSIKQMFPWRSQWEKEDERCT